MEIEVQNLASNARVWEIMAQFGKPIDAVTANYLKETGFGDGRTRAMGCMGWIWCQWLLNGDVVEIRRRVESFVERGMEMQDLSSKFNMRPMHDLYLLHCAIFASSETQLKKLAERVVDASGYRNYTPRDSFGELYASAWCGMLKYWIFGDWERAVRQSDVVWGAYRDASFRGAAKPLVIPWLKRDWSSFLKHQHKDFERLWNRARKDGTVISEAESETVVNMEMLSSIQQLWCWAHCGMAMLAHRRGIKVASDPLWFPSHALKCAESKC